MILKNIYLKILELSGKPRSEWVLAIISFTESSIFPIPPDFLLLPMTLAKPLKWLRLALITTIFSVLGGILGYFIGLFLWDVVGEKIINIYNLETNFNYFKDKYNSHGAIIVFLAGFTPIPYKLITIASGGMKLNLLTFILASLISRGLRFFIIAGIIRIFGSTAKIYIEKYFNLLTILFGIIIIVVVMIWLYL